MQQMHFCVQEHDTQGLAIVKWLRYIEHFTFWILPFDKWWHYCSNSMVKIICVVKGQGHIWPSKFKGQGYGQVQTHWSHMRPGVQSICLLFVSRQCDHFWLRYSKFYIWPWNFKVNVMAKVKPDGHIWALEFNWYACFRFVAIGPFLAEI